MAIGLGAGMIGSSVIGAGMGLWGASMNEKARREALKRMDLSIAELEKLQGQPVTDIPALSAANRASMFPRIKELSDQTSRQFNFDQPRARKYFMDRVFDTEAMMLPGQKERNQRAMSMRDLEIRRAIVAARAQQASI